MTIQRRLFISNNLMLIIPVLLSLIMAGGIMYAVTQIMDTQDRSYFRGNEILFYESVKKTDELIDKWSKDNDLELIKNDIKNFNEQRTSNVMLSIYQGKELIYPSSPVNSSPILDTAVSQAGSHLLFMDNTTVYRKNMGKYSIILTGTNINLTSRELYSDTRRPLYKLGVFMLLTIIAIILVTNRFLTRFIYKSIMTPLDTLVYGVHQIRDGNLDHHIEYVGKDEFAGVCSDFNEMARRLLDSVNARQKDEANRKELIAGISHDLRTPLTSIKAYVEGIEKGLATTPEIQNRYLDIIRNKTDDLEHIVNQLFLFSKLDIGEFPFHLEQIDIGKELSNKIAAVSEEYAKKGLTVTITQNVQNIYVQADIVQLHNAVTNVLENSVKYRNKEQAQMKISCGADDKHVTVTLADNGPGVDSEALGKLFDIFYRSDPSRSNPSKGSGLGLAITSKILERLGGSIRAENVQEGGLAIIMTLPKDTGGKNIEKDSHC